uniref:Uncharacterized protein n=1 Tax=Pristionchus pacificus TaxID=54126 RepID=A0A8R1Z9E7_PRIPA
MGGAREGHCFVTLQFHVISDRFHHFVSITIAHSFEIISICYTQFRMFLQLSIASALLLLFTEAAVIDPRLENMLNVHTNWRETLESKECNVYDEGHYCQQLVIDQRLTLVAVSQKCECPTGYRCPNDTTDTQLTTDCDFDVSRRWSKCRMRCAPIDV